MLDYPKKIKHLLREWMAQAYERELQRELLKLEQSWVEWRSGAIGSGELSYRLHQYDRGPSQALSKRYNNAPADMSVAYAIVTGLLKREEIPAELLEALRAPLSFYEALRDNDELREPDDV